MRYLLSRRRRMGDFSVELEWVLFAALHLTLAADMGVSTLATADGVMADAAASMGLQVVRF